MKINYTGDKKIIKRICEAINWMYDHWIAPTKTSDLINDGEDGVNAFITATVNNLVNYYLKSETYTQAEVDALIAGIVGMHFEVVQVLPVTDISTNTIYLVPSTDPHIQNVYDEYIYPNNAWELIGSTAIDLTNYVTFTDLNTALSDYVLTSDLTTLIASYYTKTETDILLSGKVDKITGKGLSTEDYTTAEKTKLAGIENGAEVNVQADWSESDSTADSFIQNKPTIPAAQIQSDWNQNDNTALDYIKNKPTIPTVPVVSVNGQTGAVVLDAGDVGALPDNTPLLEPLIGTTVNTTPTQASTAIQTGRPVAITYTDSTYGTIIFDSFAVGSGTLVGSQTACVHSGNDSQSMYLC